MSNPKGVALIVPSPDGGDPQTVLLRDGLGLVHPSVLIEILGMQERAFGERGLPAPDDLE